jgi:hypothetical protein
MINFVIAYKDTTPFIFKMIQGLPITFDTWHKVDGSINLVMMLCVAAADVVVQKYHLRNAIDFFKKFYY